MSGLGGEEPERGCNITSVFFKLIVRPKHLAAVAKTVHELLNELNSVCHDGTVISEQELTYQSPCDLDFGSETPQVEHSTVSPVFQVDASVICFMECVSDEHSKHDAE